MTPVQNSATPTLSEHQSGSEWVVLDYTPEWMRHFVIRSVEECEKLPLSTSVTWLDIKGLGDPATLQQMVSAMGLTPQILDDILDVPQRPKFTDYGDHCLLVCRMVVPQADGFHDEQISLILGDTYVITVQEHPQYDCFDDIRERIQSGRGMIRQGGAGYLLYALLEALVESFFPVLEGYDHRLEDLEHEATRQPSKETLTEIYSVKRELLDLRQAIRPQRVAINRLLRESNRWLPGRIRTAIRDCYDQTEHIIETVEMYRELASGLVALYLSSVNNRLNEVVKVLTIVSTIFIPLTFIAGVYGMNFDTTVSPWNMPELRWVYGYPAVWVLMLSIAGTLLTLFWRWGWLKTEETLISSSSDPDS